MKRLPHIAALLLACTTMACQREQAPGPDPASASSSPATSAPAADAPVSPEPVEGAEMTYACTDGELRVVYAGGAARLALADGREFALPRATRQAGSGLELYEAEGMTLQRQGGTITVRHPGGETQECTETSATA